MGVMQGMRPVFIFGGADMNVKMAEMKAMFTLLHVRGASVIKPLKHSASALSVLRSAVCVFAFSLKPSAFSCILRSAFRVQRSAFFTSNFSQTLLLNISAFLLP